MTALIAACGSSCAVAQVQREVRTGTHIATPAPAEIPIAGRLSDSEKARVTVDSFATCVVASNGRNVERKLVQKPAADNDRELALLAKDECLRYGELRMPTNLFRGSLYAALYRQRFAVEQPALPASVPDFAADLEAAGVKDDNGYVALRQVADCLIRRDPADARNVVLARPTSAAEGRAFVGLVPNMGSCLPGGATFRFSKVFVVGMIAEVLYREVTGAFVPLATAGKN